mmetsp:Transcript_153728/g.286550  ORF Transcript_153728/g.286550 Transcript_153728/m.286550 type:complete len:101 (-) Transcript_153728:1296-1598(-)
MHHGSFQKIKSSDKFAIICFYMFFDLIRLRKAVPRPIKERDQANSQPRARYLRAASLTKLNKICTRAWVPQARASVSNSNEKTTAAKATCGLKCCMRTIG